MGGLDEFSYVTRSIVAADKQYISASVNFTKDSDQMHCCFHSQSWSCILIHPFHQ